MSALTQTDWYINPTTGNDAPPHGNTIAKPLRTFAELSKRWGQGNLLSPSDPNNGSSPKNVTVHILDNLEKTDPLNFDVILDDNVNLWFVGEKTDDSSLSVTGTISKNRDLNTPRQFTTNKDLPVGTRIYNQNQKTYMWSVKKDQGINNFRMSEPLTMPVSADSGFFDLKRVEHGLNDTFSVQTLCNVKTGSMRVGSVHDGPYVGATNFSSLFFKDFNITGDINPELDMGTRFFCLGCRIEGSILLAAGFDRNFFNCCQIPKYTIRIISGLTRFFGGAYISEKVVTPPGSQGFLPTNCTTQFDLDVIFQEHSISIVAGNTLIIGTAGIFDSVPGGNGYTNSAGNGIMVSAGSVTCRKLIDDKTQLWGSDQIGHGVGVSSGGRFYYVSNPPTITGEKGHFTLGEATNTNSWSSLDPKGNIKNPDYDAWILKTQ